MPNAPVQAAAEGLPDVNRRRLLSTGTAAAAVAVVPAVAVAADGENPEQKIRRIGYELADALNDYASGEWFAIVQPSKQSDRPLSLGDHSIGNSYGPLQEDTDADLFRMERDYKAAMVRYEVASKAHNEAEERYFAIKQAPVKKDEWPDDLKARHKAMTVADLSNQDHPVNVEIAALWKAHEQKVEAHEKADQQARREAGVDRAEKPMNALLEKADAIARKIIRTRAHTPAGMLLKVRVNAAGAVEEDVLHAAVIKDLRSAAKRDGRLA